MQRNKPRTIGELRASGYQAISVKAEMRKNLIEKIKSGEELFPGIIGFEQSVIPQVENAILSGQDIVFLGERGQAKSRMNRSLVNLLDEEIPAIAGCEINDNPYDPICRSCRDKVEELGDEVEITWLPRERRYGEKLATPDITIADLIGEVDPIRVAEGRYLSDELTIHYGLVPRSNRGIFAINELPDLAERIQVGLFNIMEERDIQIRGYKIRLPLDVYVVASANPEDYTNRGRIITPLKDRYGSQIRTHYPKTPDIEIEIIEIERMVFDDGVYRTTVPSYMKEIIAEITDLARRSPDINQRSGVSVRVSISNYENLVSNALKRAIRQGETDVSPRISDMSSILASTIGKIELESIEDGREEQIIENLLRRATLNVFNRYFDLKQFDELIAKFKTGLTIVVSDTLSSQEYVKRARENNDLSEGIKKLGADKNPATMASAVEFILEGLHLNRRLNKDRMAGKTQYRG
ncbi:MAG: magnesium chelatase [Chloroflexi bacterium RBG_13_54_9]|nr:MAG: magnesium chelatase [Chloroflexi bacterium RBG_13_54_9]